MNQILIIASYNGPRRWSLDNSKLLELQFNSLTKFKNKLDKILIVQNEFIDIPENLNLFPDVLHRPNIGGSYEAWLDGYRANPDYEWYFFIEDDYIFNLDNFDQLMIDMWDDETSYLCSRVDDNIYGFHASISNGLTRGDLLKQMNFSHLESRHDVYDTALQVTFSKALILPGRTIKDIRDKYCSPFWENDKITLMDEKPILLMPAQNIRV